MVNLLIVDSTIHSLNTFLDSINTDTKIITYSVEDTFDILKEKIDNLQINNFDNVGFVFVDDSHVLKLFVSYNTYISFDSNGITQNNTTIFIKDLVTKYSVKNLDFLACNLLNYPEWKNYFNYLMNENQGLIVRASNNRTGNLSIGGDWILESTNEDISQLYFNNNLINYNFLLDLNQDFSIIQSIDSNLFGFGKNTYGEMNTGSRYENTEFTKIYNGTNIQKIACGGYFTMIILNNGTIWGCGANSAGQLGNGTTTNAPNFTQATITYGLNTPIDIQCGWLHTMIILNNGNVWGCGSNSNGQLGNGTTTNSSTFTQATTISNVSKLSCGYSHTMVLKNDGTVWGCGNNGSGQLGINSTSSTSTFTQANITYNPSKTVASVECGGWHTMILLNDGTVWGCGNNVPGQLGVGTYGGTYLQFTQSKLSDNSYITNAFEISCGWDHTIVKVIDIINGTFIYGSGNNEYGNLGIGNTQNKQYFTLSYSNSSITDINSIKCGIHQSFFIKNDRTIWGCGLNFFGQLGKNLSLANTSFQQVVEPGSGQITNATLLSTGVKHTIVIRDYTTYTELWGTGTDDSGQLNTSYLKKNAETLTNFNANSILCVSNGTGHTMIVKNDGTVWGCGLNDWGQLGINNTSNKTSFTQALNINNAVLVGCGSKHTMIILSNGNVYGCGFNLYGNLGDGTTTEKYIFTKCANTSNGEITDAIDISCGEGMTMIIRKNGTSKTIWGCGLNTSGQLGVSTSITDSNVFIASSGNITNAEKVECGLNYTMVLLDDGTIMGTGANNVYQLGLGHNTSPIVTFTANSTPISNVKQISCGRLFTMILKNDCTAWGCGLNDSGQIGNGTNDNIIQSFTQVTGINNAISVKSFYSHVLINLSNNKLMSCGRNNNGQLGLGDFVDRNTFTEVTYTVPKIKIINKKKNIGINASSNIQTFNNLQNVISYLPDNITSTINSSEISPTDNTSSFYGINGRDKVIKLEPSGTLFSDYINFDITVSSNPAETLVYFKSENDSQPVRIYQNPVNSYGAYYTIPEGTSNTIRIYTKHFTEVGTGTGNFCLLKGTKVLTPEGYKLIETLKFNDIIVTDDNREVPIKMIFKTIINANEKPNFIPYKIEKNSIEENYPSEDTYMSGYHMIKYGNNWIEPVQSSKFKKDLSIKEIVYYHIQLENYETDNLVVNGGLIVESLGDGSSKDGKIWVNRTENSLIIE